MSALQVAILRGASLLVPSAQRAEWLAEWRAELWYVERGAMAFCLGSLLDAWWMRRNGSPSGAWRGFGLESPVRCVVVLAVLAVASVFFAFRLPLARDILLPSPYRDARRLAMISSAGRYHAQLPTVAFEQFRRLATDTRFTGLAFYRPVRVRVGRDELSIAVASANLFEVLGVAIPKAAANGLIFSDAAWRKYAGRVVEVGGEGFAIAGVIPASEWRLPGQVDGWILRDDLRLPARAKGFVIGHLRALGDQGEPRLEWQLTVQTDRGYERFECASLVNGPFLAAYLFMFFVALLVLSALTPLKLGEYPRNREMGRRRWIFLGVKLALLLPITGCGSLDVAALLTMGLQPHGLLIGLIVGFRWALIDQRQRCPVCLRRLTNPTRIGGASHTFLSWYGTELMCRHGHGLLYVPEIATSCYNAPRWQYLDPSWSSLFS